MDFFFWTETFEALWASCTLRSRLLLPGLPVGLVFVFLSCRLGLNDVDVWERGFEVVVRVFFFTIPRILWSLVLPGSAGILACRGHWHGPDWV